MSNPRLRARARRWSAAVMLVVVVGAAGCASAAKQRQPAPDDDSIVAEIRRRLKHERRIDASEIAVAATHGVVVLSGIAGSTGEIRRALRITAQVRGVTQVVNRLRVLPTGLPPTGQPVA